MIDFGLGNGRLALVGAVLVAVMLAVPLGRACSQQLKRLVAFCRGIPLFCRIAFAAVFATLGLHSSIKTNDLTSSSFPLPPDIPGYVRPLPLAQTNTLSLVATPPLREGPVFSPMQNPPSLLAAGRAPLPAASHAERIARRWHLHGAWDDSFWFAFGGGFVFPAGTNHLAGVEVLARGELWRTPFDASPVASLGAAVSIVSNVTEFSCFMTPSNSCRFTWHAAFVGRVDAEEIANGVAVPIDAALELFRNGDVLVETNGVVSVFRRVNPHDWDGDGLANEIDANPYESDGDFFGPANILPEGANSNAYCSVSVLVSGADALVSFVGDKPSNYPDPQFIARHGVTNNVSILIGKTYDILCDQPFAVVGVSDPATEILVSEGQVRVVRPVEIECVQEPGTGFSMNVNPSNLGGAFSWNRDCCQIVSNVTSGSHAFSFIENQECLCLGCQARGEYAYEGYSLSAYGRMCPCYRVGDEPNWEATSGPVASGVSAAFTTSAVIYEETYENKPGEWIPKRSTRTRLNVGATGGPNGGTLTIDTANISKLNKLSGPMLPAMSVPVPAESFVSYSIVYEANEHSSVTNDISVIATFTEDVTGEVFASTGLVTVIEVERETISKVPPNRKRAVIGVGEEVLIRFKPVCSISTVTCVSGSVTEPVTDPLLPECDFSLFSGPHTNCDALVSICAGESQYALDFHVVEPTKLVVDGITYSYANIPNEAGMFIVEFAIHIAPTNVSFYGTEILEVPMVATNAVGYYLQESMRDELDHSKHGGGRWSAVGYGNESPDRVAHRLCKKPWSDGGSFTWPIPVAWRCIGDYGVTNVFTYADQRFELDADGTTRIFKFGYCAERTTNSEFRVERRDP